MGPSLSSLSIYTILPPFPLIGDIFYKQAAVNDQARHLATRESDEEEKRINTVYLLLGPFKISNRPGVSGAVLQAPLSLIHSFSQRVILFLPIFKTS